MLKNKRTPFFLMLLALLGLFAVQAFWIYESMATRNQQIEENLEQAAFRIKKEVEDDFYCFKLNTQTDIMDSDFLSVVKKRDGNETDTLENYLLKSGDSTFTYPKYVFNYQIPVRVQVEMKFDYLIDSISVESLQKSDIRDFAKEYREGSIVDTINGIRVGYQKSLKKIVKSNLLFLPLGEEEIGYSINHVASNRLVYTHGVQSNKDQILSIDLFDNKIEFAEPYRLEIYSQPPYKQVLISLVPFLLATVLIMVIGIIVILYWLRAWRKEKMVADFQKDMMHSLSHEMNTPISNVQLAVQSLLEKQSNTPDDSLKYLRIIEQENKILAENTSLLMDYIQIEQDKIPLRFEKINLDTLLCNVVDSFQHRIALLKGKLTLKIERNEIIVEADETHIINVVYNLLDNAIKFSEKAPLIEVNLSLQNGKAILQFADNCTKIDSQQLSSIFEKFYRAPGTKVKGQGIGLYYVKLIIDKHHGSLNVHPSHLGGNTFEIGLDTSAAK